ncbi:hypothetical protein [Myroides odoratimimus]|uniref:hypothetical protein n=1 Tax=Myroides odoratimimus TaxID=76832 RepID=UPI0025758544|nr:hypothetical protein [Myroides odoratimimus]MDM1093422.1 hypothetical protein [Myroides odoratimimus]
MAEKRTYGLKQLNSGEVTADGTMPTKLDELCRTHRDSCEFTEDDPQITEEFCDQEDGSIETFEQSGGKQIKFATFDYSPETLVKLKGGTVVNGQWASPITKTAIYQAIELITDTGLPFHFPKCRVTAKFNAKFVKNGLSLLEVVLKPMSPAPGKPDVLIGIKTP